MTRLPARTLLVTYLHDAASKRGTSIEHLTDFLAPIPEREVRCWFDGTSSPRASQLATLAEALRVDLTELVVGWMIDLAPDIEARVRPFTLDELGSRFPRQSDLSLRAPRPCADMRVGDPHDLPRAVRAVNVRDHSIRKRAAGVIG